MARKRNNINIYTPFKAEIKEVRKETADVCLFTVETSVPIQYHPGQFFMLSLWGVGEVPISVASLNTNQHRVEFCIRRVGHVTSELHKLRKGDSLWLRGPYGNGFPVEKAEGRDVIIVGGGIGLAPLRPLIQWFIKKKDRIGHVTLLYGARTPQDVVFREDMKSWSTEGIKVVQTVDRASDGWDGHVGIVTTLWHEAEVDYRDAVSFICGPEIMIKAAMKDLFFFGMSEDRIITTLEAHMKCGVGKCGHCYAGPKYICTDGPVFTYEEIKRFNLFA